MNAPPTYEIKLAGFEFAEVTWSYGHQVTHTLESATNQYRTTSWWCTCSKTASRYYPKQKEKP